MDLGDDAEVLSFNEDPRPEPLIFSSPQPPSLNERVSRLEHEMASLKSRMPSLPAVAGMDVLNPSAIAKYHADAIKYYETLIEYHKTSLKICLPDTIPPSLPTISRRSSTNEDDDYTTCAGFDDDATLVAISQDRDDNTYQPQKRGRRSYSSSDSVSSPVKHTKVNTKAYHKPPTRRSSRTKKTVTKSRASDGLIYPDPFDKKKSRHAYLGNIPQHCTKSLLRLKILVSTTSAKKSTPQKKWVKRLCYKARDFLLSIESELDKGIVPYAKLFTKEGANSLLIAQSLRNGNEETILSQKSA